MDAKLVVDFNGVHMHGLLSKPLSGQSTGLHLESGARGCKIVVFGFPGG